MSMFAICFSASEKDSDRVDSIMVFPSEDAATAYLREAGATQPRGWGVWYLPITACATVTAIYKPGNSHLDFDFAHEHSPAGQRNQAALDAWSRGGCEGNYVREDIIHPELCPLEEGTDVDGAVWLVQTWHGCTGREDSGKTYGGHVDTVVGPFPDLKATEDHLQSLKWQKVSLWNKPMEYQWERRYHNDCDDIRVTIIREW